MASNATPKGYSVSLVLRKLRDPATGRDVAAFVAATSADRSILAERGLKLGAPVRAMLSAPRNAKFNALVHGLGVVLGQNLERFAGLDSHAVIKALQVEAEAHCDRKVYDVPGLGRLTRLEPKSLAFDSMDDAAFSDFWRQCCAYIVAHDWPSLTIEQLEKMAVIAAERGQA